MPWGNPSMYAGNSGGTEPGQQQQGPYPFFPDAPRTQPQPGTTQYNQQNMTSRGSPSTPQESTGSQQNNTGGYFGGGYFGGGGFGGGYFGGGSQTGYINSYSRPYDRNSDTYAQDMRAYLAREEYNDYLRRFAPVEQELINSVMGPEMLNDRLSAVSVNNQIARRTAETSMQMQNSRYGVAANPAQAAQRKAQMDREAALSMANGMNQTRTHIYDRNMNALAGGSGAIRGTIREGYGG